MVINYYLKDTHNLVSEVVCVVYASNEAVKTVQALLPVNHFTGKFISKIFLHNYSCYTKKCLINPLTLSQMSLFQGFPPYTYINSRCPPCF